MLATNHGALGAVVIELNGVEALGILACAIVIGACLPALFRSVFGWQE